MGRSRIPPIAEIHVDDLAMLVTLLERMYGFYLPLEHRLGIVLTGNVAALDLPRHTKHPLIRHDLVVLGRDDGQIAQLPLCADLPMVMTVPDALGCMYVLEGATLGGQIIIREVREQWGLTGELGGAFFTSYGHEVGPMWRTFCNVLAAMPYLPATKAPMIAAACTTFTVIERWLVGASVPTSWSGPA